MTQVGAAARDGVYTNARQLAVSAVEAARLDPRSTVRRVLPAALTSLAFVLLFSQPLVLLFRDWWNSPEAGHGLLLGPVAVWLAWRAGIRRGAAPSVSLGFGIIAFAVLVRYASGLAAELFTMRLSIVMALAGLTVYYWGFRQLLHWWLPFVLAVLAIPLPAIVIQSLALPLQFKASQLGAALLKTREIPVLLSGNVIHLPGNDLFVTEACSGLRSLTALISLSILMGALALRRPVSRIALVLAAVLVAVLINGVRVFLTGFLVYFVDPALGRGFMHITEGWLLFLVSLSCIGAVAWVAARTEQWALRRRVQHA